MKKQFDTLAVHAGEASDGPLDLPLVRSSAFGFADAGDAAARFQGALEGPIYGRWGNPSVQAFERKVAALEGAPACAALASGMAAIHGVLATFLRSGAHVIAPIAVYAETAKLLRDHFMAFGVEVDFVDQRDLDAIDAAWRENTALVWAETPANPVLTLTDIGALSERCRAKDALLVVDATFATPYHQRSLSLGADLVVHSATKALGGHGDAIGGVVCGDHERIELIRKRGVRATGGMLAPDVAWLLARGVKTLGLRMARSSSTALEIARRLDDDPRVEDVHYPGLGSHPDHALARRQMLRGFGSLIALELEGGAAAGARAYDKLDVFTRAVSLGDVRSLVTHPASTTHASMPGTQRLAAGITDGLLRLSIGIEDVEDLWRDLDRALG